MRTPPLHITAILAGVGIISAGVQRWSAPILQPPLERNANRFSAHVGSRDYPREAIDSDGFRVRIERKPIRIASQFWSIDEYLYSIVPPERVVAVSSTAFLPGASNVYDLVQQFKPVIAADPEIVLRRNPDLLLVSSGGRADFTSLVRSADVAVYRMFTDFTTLAQIEETVRLVGYLTGEDARAEEEAFRFRAAIDHARLLRPAGARPVRLLGMGGRYSYGSQTLFDDIAKTLGCVNVAAANGLTGYDAINSEQIARWNPEWIVAGASLGQKDEIRKRLLADPGIALTEAARTGHILIFEYNVFLAMSPYAALRVTALAEALWK